jgi:hypothetical protein
MLYAHSGYCPLLSRGQFAASKEVGLTIMKVFGDLWDVIARDETDQQIPNVPVSGLFAPRGKVKLESAPFNGPVLRFPAKAQWYQDAPQMKPFIAPAWVGWYKVELEPLKALGRFIQIESPQEAQLFAQRYGPLWICGSHHSTEFQCFFRGVTVNDRYGILHRWQNPEPVRVWLKLAIQMRTVLEVYGRYFTNNKGIRPEDIDRMGFYFPSDAEQWRETLNAWAVNPKMNERHLELTKYLLRQFVNGNNYHLNVGVLLDVELHPLIHSGLGFVPSLWQQIIAIIAGSTHFIVCSGCGKLFQRERAPKRGHKNYCLTCNRSHMRQTLSREALASARTKRHNS